MFSYTGKSHLINECVKIANDLVHNNNYFHEQIQDAVFDMATCDGEQIDSDIVLWSKRPHKYINIERQKLESELVINYELIVKTYKSKNPWSKAYGYFSPAKSDHIFLNTRKLNRSKGSIVSSLIHEMIHYVDDKNKMESYGHGDNKPTGKENTAPYWIDNLAESIIDDKLPDFNNVENANIKYYVPFYKKVWNFFKRLF